MIIDLRKKSDLSDYHFEGYIFGLRYVDYQDYILNCYKKSGINFIKEINGSFCGYIKDLKNNKLIVFNDRYGIKDLYMYSNIYNIVISSDYNSIVKIVPKKTIDRQGVLEFVKFLYPLYEKTFLKEIKHLPQATILIIDLKKLKILQTIKYWDCKFTNSDKKPKHRNQLKEELWSLFNTAIEESFCNNQKKYAIANSGGLDSRTILYLAKNLGKSFISYTYGDKKSEAYYIANKLASKLTLEQRFIPIEHNFLAKYWDIHIERKPLMSVFSSWYYSSYRCLKDIDTNVNGFDSLFLGKKSYADCLKLYNHDITKGFTRIWELSKYCDDDLFNKLIIEPNESEIYDHYISNIKYSCNDDIINVLEEFEIKNRQRKLNKNEAWTDYLGQTNMRCPLLHNELVDFSLKLPFIERQDRKLYFDTMKDYLTKINHIRFDRCSYNLKDDIQNKRLKDFFWKYDKKLYRKMGISLLYKGTHKNVLQWLFHVENYKFIQSIFNDGNDIFDSIFDSKYITMNLSKILKSNNWQVIGSILTLKLWLKKYC